MTRDPRKISDSATLIATLSRKLTLLADALESPAPGTREYGQEFNARYGLARDGYDHAVIGTITRRDIALAVSVLLLRRADSNDAAHEFTTLPFYKGLLTGLRALDAESLYAVIYACPTRHRAAILAAFDKRDAWVRIPEQAPDLAEAIGLVAQFSVEPLVPLTSGEPAGDEWSSPELAAAVLQAFNEGGQEQVTTYLRSYQEELHANGHSSS